MLTLAVISQKGGAGKTTLAVNLAVAAERGRRRGVLVDLDPQATASAWHDRRKQRDLATPPVVAAPAPRLPEILDTARDHGAHHAIIDTAPHSESASLAAARAADLVLIPCRPSIADLDAIATSADLASIARTPALAVLNAAPPRGSLATQAEAAIATYSLPIATTAVGHRVAFVHAMTAGLGVTEYEPGGKAAAEIQRLWRWLNNQLNATQLKETA